MAFTFNNLCPDGEWKGSGDKLTEGSLPSLVSIVGGNALLYRVYWLLFMPFIIPITVFFVAHIREGDEVRGGIYVDKYVENWLSMDLFARADLFVWRQTEVAFVRLPAEPWLSPSMARHSGDKHQLAGPLHWHHHFLPESADYILEVDSLLSLWIAGGLNLLFFLGLPWGWGVVSSGHWFRRLPLLVPSAVTHTVNRPLSPPLFSSSSKSACTL